MFFLQFFSTELSQKNLIIAAAPCYIASAKTTQITSRPRVLFMFHVAVAQMAWGLFLCFNLRALA